MRVEASLRETIALVALAMRNQGFSQFVPLLTGISIDKTSVVFRKKLGPVIALIRADAHAVAGAVELDIQDIKASGVPMGWALRKKAGEAIVSELAPYAQFVRCWKAENGNLRFALPGATITQFAIAETGITVSASL